MITTAINNISTTSSPSSTSQLSSIRVLSANENLVERLRLALEAAPLASINDQTSATTAADAGGGNAITTTTMVEVPALLFGQWRQCDWRGVDGWLLLVGKGVDQRDALEALGNVYRALCSSSQSPHSKQQQKVFRLLLVKNEGAAPGDVAAVLEALSALSAQWATEWERLWEKYLKLGASDARTDYLEKVARWKSPLEPTSDAIEHAVIDFEDANFAEKVSTFLGLNAKKMHISEVVDRPTPTAHQLPTKPPALHWTATPREGELQAAFKFVFPAGTLTDPLLRSFASALRQEDSSNYASTAMAAAWQYAYEWSGGIFLRPYDNAGGLVKIAMVRTGDDALEVSARIDADEAEAEEEGGGGDEDGGGATTTAIATGGGDVGNKPAIMAKVWPHLVRAIDALTVGCIEETLPNLPYQLSLIFIGARFFGCFSSQSSSNTAPPPPAPAPSCNISCTDPPAAAAATATTAAVAEVTSRSLDTIQSLCAIQRAGAVRFKVGEVIYALRLAECFPGFKPTSMTSFSPKLFPLPPPPPPTRPANPFPPKVAVVKQMSSDGVVYPNSGGFQPSSGAESPPGNGAPPNPHGLRVESAEMMGMPRCGGGGAAGGAKGAAAAMGARGRRVSFGAIRAIPTPPAVAGEEERENDAAAENEGNKKVEEDSAMGEATRNGGGKQPRSTEGGAKKEVVIHANGGSGTIDGYVEGLLQKTMDELLIIDTKKAE